MLNTLIVGASGYAGAELVTYINRHPHMNITALTVSAQSNDAGKLISDLHPQLKGIVDMPLQPMSDISEFSAGVDVVFLATAHEVSHDLAPQFLAAGCVVFDLSGAFRVNDGAFYEKYYGFTHQHPELLKQAVYGLAEWSADALKEAQLIAVPGCYPTAAQLSLKPLIDAGLLDLNQWPVINATSGVSGAGRKAAIGNRGLLAGVLLSSYPRRFAICRKICAPPWIAEPARLSPCWATRWRKDVRKAVSHLTARP